MARYANAYKKAIVEEILGGADKTIICQHNSLNTKTVTKWIKKYNADSKVFDDKPLESIKEELQGNGIIKILKPDFIGSTKFMAETALIRYEKRQGHSLTRDEIMNNTDEVLKNLLNEETTIFNERMQSFGESILPLYYDRFYRKPNGYLHMEDLMNSIIDTYNRVKLNDLDERGFIDEISKEIIPVSHHIATSNSQSAKTRAGAALENHLALLMERCGFKYEQQVKIEDGETIADFFLPNLKAAEVHIQDVMNIECQTTLKDRHRLTTGKFTDQPIKRYLATGTGIGLFTKKDINDFSLEKLKELILINGIRIIVFAEVKDKLLTMIDEELDKQKNKDEGNSADGGKKAKLTVSDLTRLKSRARGSIFSYKQLFCDEINPQMELWKIKKML